MRRTLLQLNSAIATAIEQCTSRVLSTVPLLHKVKRLVKARPRRSRNGFHSLWCWRAAEDFSLRCRFVENTPRELAEFAANISSWSCCCFSYVCLCTYVFGRKLSVHPEREQCFLLASLSRGSNSLLEPVPMLCSQFVVYASSAYSRRWALPLLSLSSCIVER